MTFTLPCIIAALKYSYLNQLQHGGSTSGADRRRPDVERISKSTNSFAARISNQAKAWSLWINPIKIPLMCPQCTMKRPLLLRGPKKRWCRRDRHHSLQRTEMDKLIQALQHLTMSQLTLQQQLNHQLNHLRAAINGLSTHIAQGAIVLTCRVGHSPT